MKKPEVVLVSACLLGLHTRYDGGTNPEPDLLEPPEGVVYVPVCPEQLGGLPTPRPPCEFERADGRAVLEGRDRLVEVESRRDRTEHFLRGARETLAIARLVGARRAILKESSPSCGLRWVYRQGKRVPGTGVTAALLQQHGMEVESRG